MSQTESGHEQQAHASVATYIKVAILLAVITVIEIAVPYLPNRNPRWLFVAIMIGLSLVKFYYVVAFFMHLKYDTKFFSQQFVFAMVISVGTFVAVKFLSDPESPALAAARAAGTALPADWRYDLEAHQAGATALEMGRKPEATGGDAAAGAADGSGPGTGSGDGSGGGAAHGGNDAKAERTIVAAAAEPMDTAAVAVAGGNPEAGKAVFINGGCTACHKVASVPGAVGTVGPELDGLMQRAGSRVPGMDADAYIRQSIEDPNAFTVEGYLKVMPPVRATFSDQQYEDLIAFLKTL